MFPCRLLNGLCFLPFSSPEMVSMAGSFAAQPQLLIFLMPFDLWLILSRPFTPCMLAIDVRLQKDSIWPWWLDVFFPVEFCDLRLPFPPWPSQSSRTDACHPPRTRQVKNASTSMSIAVVTATVIKGVWSVCVFHPLSERGFTKAMEAMMLVRFFATTMSFNRSQCTVIFLQKHINW